MIKFKAYLLQTPKVLLNGTSLDFPYKKTEALLYYLLTEKTVTRDTIANLLWTDTSMETARKNLRHALYMLRKSTGTDLIISNQRSTLTLNPEIQISCDLDLFLSGDTSVYQEDFLHGFSVKKAELYEDWMEEKQEYLRHIYLVKLYEHINSLSFADLSELELSCTQYMHYDPFDERVVSRLMRAYQENHLYLKAINLYQELKRELESELGIIPGEEIVWLYKEIRKEWADSSTSDQELDSHVITGRAKESAMLDYAIQRLLDGENSCIMVDGENGIGKTYLINNKLKELSSDQVFLLRTSCFTAESENLLHPWNAPVMKIDAFLRENHIFLPASCIQAIAQFFPTFADQPVSDPAPFDLANPFTLRAVENGLLRAIEKIAEVKPVLLVFENLHFADSATLQILLRLVTEIPSDFMLLFTCLDVTSSPLSEFICQLQQNELLTPVHLKRFSPKDMREIIEDRTNINEIPEDILNLIYTRTAGNAFFLNELLTAYEEHGNLSALSLTAQNILLQRLHGLSPQARQVLDIISLFHDYASSILLEHMTGQSASVIQEVTEELHSRSLIQESSVNGELRFSFKHEQMRLFVCGQMASLKRRILYDRIGQVLETLLPMQQPSTYNTLVHYFALAGNEEKVLTYQIYPFEALSVSLFELYPSMEYTGEEHTPANIDAFFASLENRLTKNEQTFSHHELYDELESRLLICESRYYILCGRYCDGLHKLNICLSNPWIQAHPDYQLRAWRQMIYYGIQLYQPALMLDYLDRGIALAREQNIINELAVYLRLKGLYEQMTFHYDQSEVYFNESIQLLQYQCPHDTASTLNIAAALNYIGENRRKQRCFDEAVSYYHQSVSLALKSNIQINPTHFTNMARAYLALGRMEKSCEYFEHAVSLYDQSFVLMERSVAKGYYALFCAEAGNFEHARHLLSDAVDACNQLGSPIEKGILRKNQAELLRRYPDEFRLILPESLEFYKNDARTLLSRDPGCYEVEDL